MNTGEQAYEIFEKGWAETKGIVEGGITNINVEDKIKEAFFELCKACYKAGVTKGFFSSSKRLILVEDKMTIDDAWEKFKEDNLGYKEFEKKEGDLVSESRDKLKAQDSYKEIVKQALVFGFNARGNRCLPGDV